MGDFLFTDSAPRATTHLRSALPAAARQTAARLRGSARCEQKATNRTLLSLPPMRTIYVEPELPEYTTVAGDSTVLFERNGLRARLWKRRWAWCLCVVGVDSGIPTMGRALDDLEVALARAVAFIDGAFYENGRPRPVGKGFVYGVRSVDGGPIKIGHANIIENRLRSLQTGRPDELEVFAWFRGSADLERALHARYDDLRLRGEWFRTTTNLMLDLEDFEEMDEDRVDIMAWIEARHA